MVFFNAYVMTPFTEISELTCYIFSKNKISHSLCVDYTEWFFFPEYSKLKE